MNLFRSPAGQWIALDAVVAINEPVEMFPGPHYTRRQYVVAARVVGVNEPIYVVLAEGPRSSPSEGHMTFLQESNRLEEEARVQFNRLIEAWRAITPTIVP